MKQCKVCGMVYSDDTTVCTVDLGLLAPLEQPLPSSADLRDPELEPPSPITAKVVSTIKDSGPSSYFCITTIGRKGPMDFDGLRSLAVAGTLARRDGVWCEGMTDWTSASMIEGLFVGLPPDIAREPQDEAPPTASSTTTYPPTSKISNLSAADRQQRPQSASATPGNSPPRSHPRWAAFLLSRTGVLLLILVCIGAAWGWKAIAEYRDRLQWEQGQPLRDAERREYQDASARRAKDEGFSTGKTIAEESAVTGLRRIAITDVEIRIVAREALNHAKYRPVYERGWSNEQWSAWQDGFVAGYSDYMSKHTKPAW